MDALVTLQAALAGFMDGTRQHRLALPGSPAVVVERWQGREAMSQGFDYWVDVLSTDAALDVQDWLAQPAQLQVRAADGGTVVRGGLVNEAERLGSDGGLARYRVRLVGWSWWLSQSRHSRVFQDRSVIEIVEAVFAAYAPQASWRWSDETRGFLAEARPRGYCVQYRESDMAFVDRLLAEEGIGWRMEACDDAPAGHRMVLFSDSSAQARNADGSVRYHRADATEDSDTLQLLGRRRRLGAGQLAVLSSSYATMQASSAQLPLEGGGRQSLREVYDPVGEYAFASAAEAERHAGLMAQAQESRWSPWEGEGSARGFRAGEWFAVSQWPHGQAPELLITTLTHAAVNNLPLDARKAARDLLGEVDAPLPVATSVWARAEAVGYANRFTAVERARPWRPVLSDETGARLNPRPTAPGYQTARVVGPEAALSASGSQEVHADAQGRIRVKFHFQDDADASASQDSTWLRVAQRYAGPGVGSQFLPRIGQEVLVGFLGGDIDRPVVLGALYNGRGEAGVPATPGGREAASDPSAYAQAGDARPSAQGNLAGGHAPAWHAAGGGDDGHRHGGALWGVQSKEWGGSGHSRLVFDDSDQQLRVQLATTQAHTQLSLGHLVHQADNYRGSFRGEGFELRSDAWGAIRAERGLWLSSYGHGDTAAAGEATQPVALLRQLQTLGGTFSQVAGTHMTARLAAHEGVRQANASLLIPDQAPLQALLTSASTVVPGIAYDEARTAASERSAAPGENKVPHSGDALLGLAAPAGIGLVAGQGLTWSVGETLTLASGQHSETAVAGQARLHSGQSIGLLAAAKDGAQDPAHSLSVVSGEGELDVQAQNDAIRVQSQGALKMISANAALELAAGKTITLATAGGASITIEGGNISVACPGSITVHAAKKSFVGPVHLSRELNSWPSARFNEKFRVELPDGEAARNYRYSLERADGAVISGVTDSDGLIPLQQGWGLEEVSIRILGPAEEGHEA